MGNLRKINHEEVLDRWARGETSGDIADAMGLRLPQTAGVIVARARKRGDARALPRTGNRLPVCSAYFTVTPYLAAEAEKRGMGPRALIKLIVAEVLSADLIAAVVDTEA